MNFNFTQKPNTKRNAFWLVELRECSIHLAMPWCWITTCYYYHLQTTNGIGQFTVGMRRRMGTMFGRFHAADHLLAKHIFHPKIYITFGPSFMGEIEINISRRYGYFRENCFSTFVAQRMITPFSFEWRGRERKKRSTKRNHFKWYRVQRAKQTKAIIWRGC